MPTCREMEKRLAYLSGAPRVSTRPEAGAAGPRSHVLGMMRAFERLGWEVRPFIVGDRVPVAWVRGEQSANALRRNWARRAAADVLRLGMGWLNGWRAWKEIGPVDLVYERYGAFQALGWWFRRQGIPWILETNALLSLEATKDRGTVVLGQLLREHERWAYHRCDVLVCISQALADQVVQETGISTDKVVVLPNGVDVERINPVNACPRRFFEGPTLGFVGQFHPWQRLDLLLDSLATLWTEGIGFYLVVIGDGMMRVPWESKAVALGLSERVRFVGAVSWNEVPDYIAGFDLGYAGAIPLSVGAMYLSPLKLYEYAAMGRPIVAAAYADAQRLMEDGVAVYLFEPGNQEDLCRALRQAYAERDLWVQKGVRSRAIIVERHSWEARVRELISRVESILEAKYGTPYPARRHS
jgi:glycosyltransferase involved in cell wall biosynthesis